jgi:hypothetical protein
MYEVPEPSVPEAVKALLFWKDTPEDARKPFEIDDEAPPGSRAYANAMIVEAYHRGKAGQ